jgi:hypothetical protein
MQANNVISADYGKRKDGAKRAMPSTSTTIGASQSASSAQPRKKTKTNKDKPSVLLHLMESQSNIQLSGSGSKGSEGKGVKCKVAWYHEEWQPVDAARYGDSVCKESLRVLSVERAQMSCKHCKQSFNFNPSTRFRNHWLFDCDGFGTTDTYQSGPVQVDLNEEKQKFAHKNKVRTMQESGRRRTHTGGHMCMSVTWFWSSIMSLWSCQVRDVLSGQPMSWRFTRRIDRQSRHLQSALN